MRIVFQDDDGTEFAVIKNADMLDIELVADRIELWDTIKEHMEAWRQREGFLWQQEDQRHGEEG